MRPSTSIPPPSNRTSKSTQDPVVAESILSKMITKEEDWGMEQLAELLSKQIFKGGRLQFPPDQYPLSASTIDLLMKNGAIDVELEALIFFARVSEKSSVPVDNNTATVPVSPVGSNARGPGGLLKTRIICIGVIPGRMIYKVFKVKEERDGTPVIAKSWELNAVKSMESLASNKPTVNPLLIQLGSKMYHWIFEKAHHKTIFYETIYWLCQSLVKTQPILLNLPKPIPSLVSTDSLARSRKMKSSSSLQSINQASLPPTARNSTTALDKSLNQSQTYPAAVNPIAAVEEHPKANIDEEILSLEKLNAPIPAQVDISEVLQDFNWQARSDANDLEAKLLAELQALEAANVHAIIQSEDHANEVLAQLDQTIHDLDVIEDWLNHYTHVLDSMGADVHQVELRNKSLQTAAANQKLLLSEMEKLLLKLKLPGYIIEILRNEPLEFTDGILQCEEATDKLMAAIRVKLDHGFDNLASTKERITLFQSYGNEFATRLCDHLNKLFQTQTIAYLQDEQRSSKRGNVKMYGHEALEDKLFRFHKLLVWLKDVDARKSTELQMEIGKVYVKEIHELFEQLRLHHIQKKVQPEDLEYLFVNQSQSAAAAATSAVTHAMMKSAVAAYRVGDIIQGGKTSRLPKDSKLKGSTLRGRKDEEEAEASPRKLGLPQDKSTTLTSSIMSLDVSADERMSSDEVYGHALAMLMPTMTREQNLIVDIFAIKPSDDLKTASLKSWQESLSTPREQIKDLKLQKRILDLLEPIFGKVKEEFSTLVDIGIKQDQSFALGMLVRTEEYIKEYENTSCSFIMNILNGLYKKVSMIFEKFIEEQQKVIEETKVTIKKRSGLLPIFKTFPIFVDRMERFAHVVPENTSQTRQLLNKCYERIIKTLFETLDAVVKDVNMDGKQSADDKEQVNAFILMIENMHYMYSETRARKVPYMDSYVKQAKASYDLNLSTYCKVVIRRPLGKLLEFFEGIEDLLKTQAPEEISFNLSFSKNVLKDVLKKYPGKEIRKGLEALYRRVDKHFTEEEGTGQLLQVVWRGIQEEVVRQLRRYEELIAKCYPNFGIHLEFTVDEILQHFSDLAMAH